MDIPVWRYVLNMSIYTIDLHFLSRARARSGRRRRSKTRKETLMKKCKNGKAFAASLTMLLIVAGPAQAQTDANRIDELEAKAVTMATDLAALRAELEQAKAQAPAADVQALREETVALRQAAQRAEKSADEWKNTTSVTHLAGYASADYVSPENGSAAFVANFNPMFHFQYNDRILWEAELEFQVEEDGNTEIGLEYSTIDVFINDNLVFLAGKFLSPIGNFRQNTHPSWINKLPSAPPGFGHDGAAPRAEVGIQLRGGATETVSRSYPCG